MRAYAYFCDICAASGEIRLAVARYFSDEGKEWHTCKKHLSDVINAGCDYEEFSNPGDVESYA